MGELCPRRQAGEQPKRESASRRSRPAVAEKAPNPAGIACQLIYPKRPQHRRLGSFPSGKEVGRSANYANGRNCKPILSSSLNLRVLCVSVVNPLLRFLLSLPKTGCGIAASASNSASHERRDFNRLRP